MKRIRLRPLLWLPLWFAATLALTGLALPLVAAAPVAAAGLALLARRGGLAGAGVSALSLLLCVVAAEAALRIAGGAPNNYRPDEMLLTRSDGRPHYRPNSRIDAFASPHGDLVALAAAPPAGLAEPRAIRFVTDSLGFRNEAEYAGEPFVVVGDSFVAGTGNDQDSTLVARLRRGHGIAAYAAGVPSDPPQYPALFGAVDARAAALAPPARPRAVVLVFEGNDLPCPEDRPLFAPKTLWWQFVPGEIRRLETYRLANGLLTSARARLDSAQDSRVRVVALAGGPFAFYRPYVAVAARPNGDGCDWDTPLRGIAGMADRIALLAFVPTKWRVYAPLLAGAAAVPPSQRAAFLADFAARRGIAFVDLTPSLAEAAQAGLAHGRLVYWRDDTHWNAAGIDVAAAAIAASLPR